MDDGRENINERVSNTLEETSLKICPTLGSNYYSTKFIETSFLTNRIDCTKVNFDTRD